MLIIDNFSVSFYTYDMGFIKKVTEQSKVDDTTYSVYIRFYFKNHYTREGLLYHIEVVIQDYDRPIKQIEKYCVLTMDDVGQLNIKNKDYVFKNIIGSLFSYPKDLKVEDISIRIF